LALELVLLILEVLELVLHFLVLLRDLKFEGVLLGFDHMLKLTLFTAGFLKVTFEGTHTLEVSGLSLSDLSLHS
jgi:hypothetical protein